MSSSQSTGRSLARFVAAIAAMLAAPPLTAQSPDAAAPPVPAAGAAAAVRERIEAGQYEQAVEEARRLVSQAESRKDAGEELQVALMNLAVAQYLAADYAGAEASYLRVIELIEASGRPTSPRLARAEAGLAATYHAAQRHDVAVQRFDRAVALSRRSEGLFNEAQLPLLEKYAVSLTAIGRFEDAAKVQRYSLKVVERRYGAESLEYARQLEAVGRWYAQVRAFDASRAALRRAIGIVEEKRGENAVELVGPLTALAECDRRQLLDAGTQEMATADDQRRAMFHDPAAGPLASSLSSSSIATEGQKALERAVEIATRGPDPSPAQVADVRTQMGDWYQSRMQPDKALPHYQLAWQAAAGQTVGGKPLAERLFGRPVLLHYAPPSGWDRYFGRPAGEAAVRNTAVSFTVTAQGRVLDPKVLEDGGAPRLAAQAVRATQGARYRPRFDQGRPVDTPDVRLDQPFFVPADDAEEAPAPKPGP